MSFSSALDAVNPCFVPGFAFAWLELVSHRTLMPNLLLAKQNKGWAMMHRLLVDLFVFMEPHLRRYLALCLQALVAFAPTHPRLAGVVTGMLDDQWVGKGEGFLVIHFVVSVVSWPSHPQSVRLMFVSSWQDEVRKRVFQTRSFALRGTSCSIANRWRALGGTNRRDA